MTEETIVKTYSPLDKQWTDYVMGLMREHEVYKDAPTCAGLRRLVEVVAGQIVECHSSVKESPREGNDYRALVETTVVIMPPDGIPLRYTDIGECSRENTDPEFYKYPVSMAATRSKARVFREILKLEKVYAVEEMSKNTQEDINKKIQVSEEKPTKEYQNNPITDPQKGLILKLVKQSGADLDKIILEFQGKKVPLDQVHKSVAAKIIPHLNQLMQNS